MRQKELARRFASGDQSGQASNMTIVAGDDGRTHLVGYGWAIYATRERDGTVTLHDGWRGYSVTTSTKHLPAIRSFADVVDDDHPTLGGRSYEGGYRQEVSR